MLAPPDWSTWTPRDLATLIFLRRGHELLLIRKKRGLGAGKINAPGGRLEPGETPAQAALRELQEEVGMVAQEPRERGQLRFQFVDGYSLHCFVFMSERFEGLPIETDEASPLWVPLDRLPYAEMWADDELWLPRMLAGYTFDGRFLFDKEAMLSVELSLGDPAVPLFRKLDEIGIEHQTRSHPPVFTVAEAQQHRVWPEGAHVKNLFVRNKKGEMALLTLPEAAAVELKALGRDLGLGHLSFASSERLRRHLGVEPGSVTPLASFQDIDGQVQVALARSLAEAPQVVCHPLTCDRSTLLSGPDLLRFLAAVGHPARIIEGC